LSIVAAHRAPKRTMQFASEIESSKVQVVIAGGTGSAHLPGMLASLTTIPVIGIPLKGESLEGLDSLFSMLQMPKGIPLATIGINSAFNAGVLACEILCLKFPDLKYKLIRYRESLEREVELEDTKLQFHRQNKKKKFSTSETAIVATADVKQEDRVPKNPESE
jgi:5-(carboxyamino)imidazole ribonucleotide mutase